MCWPREGRSCRARSTRLGPRSPLRERPEPAQKGALEVSAVARGECEGGVDASRGALGEIDADVGRKRRDEIGGGIEPDVAIEGALGVDETVDEAHELGAGVVAVCGEDRVAFGDER